MDGKNQSVKWYLVFGAACLMLAGIYGMMGGILGHKNMGAIRAQQVQRVEDSGTGDCSLRLFLGNLGAGLREAAPVGKADKRVLALMYQRLGEVADIRLRKTSSKHVFYRITLKEKRMDTQGKLVTADTLLYNYYLRCRTDQIRIEEINKVAICGRKAYRYGCRGAALKAREQKVAELIRHPTKAWKQQLQSCLIIPVLTREYSWVESLYLDPVCRELCRKYPEPSGLFAHYYAINTSYTGKGKTKAEVIREIAAQYGAATEKLSDITGEDYHSVREGLAIQYLWPDTGTAPEGIGGIRKIDDQTIEIKVAGFRRKDQKRLGAITLLTAPDPQETESDRKISDSDQAELPLLQNRMGRFPVGTGDYLFLGETKEQLILQANPYREHSGKRPVRLLVSKKQYTSKECVEAICDDQLDLACVWDRLVAEKDGLKKELKTKKASSRIAAYGGVICHAGRVNVTTISREAANQEDVNALLSRLEMN